MLIQVAYSLDLVNESITYSNFRVGNMEYIEEDSEIISVYNNVFPNLPTYSEFVGKLTNENWIIEDNLTGYIMFEYCVVYETNGVTVSLVGASYNQLSDECYYVSSVPYGWYNQ